MKHLPILLVAIAAIAIGAVAGSIGTLLTPFRYAQIVEPPTDSTNAKEFHGAYAQSPEDYVFIDVRQASTYAEGHPQGAVNIPLHELYTRKDDLPREGKKIAIICGGDSSSSVAYGYLTLYGFTNLERIDDGYRAWVAYGLPIEGAPSTE